MSRPFTPGTWRSHEPSGRLYRRQGRSRRPRSQSLRLQSYVRSPSTSKRIFHLFLFLHSFHFRIFFLVVFGSSHCRVVRTVSDCSSDTPSLTRAHRHTHFRLPYPLRELVFPKVGIHTSDQAESLFSIFWWKSVINIIKCRKLRWTQPEFPPRESGMDSYPCLNEFTKP